MTLHVEAGDVHVRSTLKRLDPCLHPALLGALADHLGYSVQPLEKAAPDFDVDPRYPWLRTLIEQARADWERHGTRLVDELVRLLRTGKLLPMTPESAATLRAVFESHEVGIAVSFTGEHHNRETLQDLVDRGLIDSGYARRGVVPLSYRLGRGLNVLEAHKASTSMLGRWAFENIVEDAMAVELTPDDLQAMQYARRRAGIYMRRPAVGRQTELERVLTEAERWAVGDVVARGVEQRRTTGKVAQDLQAAAQGSTLTNDMDRVARTELHFAHSHGAYMGLKHATRSIGVDDPEVYKIVRPGACTECRRIWGPPSEPIRYKLSYVEQRDASGGNFRMPREQWGPVIGPVHPNCAESALLYYTPELHDATQAALADLDQWFGT